MTQIFANKKFPIVAYDYGGQLDIPILSDKSFFPELLKLKGEQGAKSFLKNYPKEIATDMF